MRRTFGFCLVAAILGVMAWRAAAAGTGTEEWKPVPPEDLALKDNPASPGADAMILYREDFVNEKYAVQDGSYIDEYMRTKIFTDKGKSWGDVEIAFDRTNSDIKDVKARTIEPDGTIVNFEGKPFEKTIVKASGYKFLAKTFTMPDVKPGCIIEYRYRQQFKPQYLYDEHWTVSEELFTREAHFSITPYVPGYYDPNFPLLFRTYGIPSSRMPQRQPDGTYTMTVNDIPGIEDEPLMPPRGELEARVEFFHRDSDAPQNETADHFWARTGKTWNEYLERFINKKSALQADLSQTVAAGDSPEVKLQKIYARAQKIRNLSYEDARSESEMKREKMKEIQNVEDVLKNNYGYGRDINFLFIGLARAAGFEATAVYVAPRNVNAFNPAVQNAKEIEDDIVWVKAGGTEYYLDPATKFCPFPMLPWNETATKGLRISKQGGEVVQTPPPKPQEAVTTRTADLTIDEDGNATGTVVVDIGGQRAMDLRFEDMKEDNAGLKKNFEDMLQGEMPSGARIEVTKVSDWEDIYKPIHIEATVKAGSFATPAGHRLLVPSTLFQETMVKNFEPQRRINSVYFHYPFKYADTVTLHLPEEFKVESLPKPKNDNPGAITYTLASEQKGNEVVTKRDLSENMMIYDLKYYGALRAFFNTVKSNDNSQIVFQGGAAKGD